MSSMGSLHGVLPARTRRCTRSLGLLARVRLLLFLHSISLPDVAFADIAKVGTKVIDFYKKKGGEVVSPLVKAL
jgi:hypothetical protein